MANDEKNFRFAYYEKVGCKGVEEKKSLEILLKEKPLDIHKLKQFCLRFAVPPSYRCLLWKAMLQVTSRYPKNAEFVWKQRVEQYEELLHSLQVMQLITSNTPKPEIFLLLWLLEIGELKFDLRTQLEDFIFKSLAAISRSIVVMVENDVDRYWIVRGLYRIPRAFQNNLSRLTDSMLAILEKEDAELYAHLRKLAAFDVIRMDRWFSCLFAGVIHDSALVKVWDKLIGGSLKILTFAAVTILVTLRRPLLAAKTADSVLDEVTNISAECSDVISNKAIDLWQQYGSPLLAFDARKEDVRT